MYDYEYNQRDATIHVYVNLIFLVSSTYFGWCHGCVASMTPAGSDIGEYYQML
jgi:hypothetical protein